MAPLVSVVLPVRNRAATLRRALDSVLAQSVTDLEVVVVDDASTDASRDVVRAVEDDRVRLVELPARVGAAAARNRGIDVARGAHLAFQDSDDEWFPHKLERQLGMFDTSADPKLRVVGCGWVTATRRGDLVVLPTARGSILADILTGRARGLGTPMLLVRGHPDEVRVRFDERYPALQDRDLTTRLARTVHFDGVTEPLVRVHRGLGDHVANAPNVARALALLLDEHAEFLEAHPSVRTVLRRQRARHLAMAGERWEAASAFASAAATGPSWRDRVASAAVRAGGRRGFVVADRLLDLTRATEVDA